jgi:lysophospholipase L1-like esterase
MTDRIPRLHPERLVALALVALAGAGTRGDEGRWVGTWAASPQRTEPANMPPAPGLADATLRQVARVSLGGKRLRVRFSNAFGEKSLTIRSAHVATPAGGPAIRAESRKLLAFGGRSSVTIPRGALVVSDPVDFDLAPLSDLAVTVRVKDPTDAVTGHPGARCTSYLQAGDAVAERDLPRAASTPHWYYLCGVDVDAPAAEAAAVAVLGDSITDGRGSPTDGNGRWTDHLARRLHEREGTARVGVLNQGLGGNRLLNDGLGPNALARLDRDVLAQPGVRWLIVLEGINDLGTRSATAGDLIGAYEQIIERAHARGIKTYGATILPCEGSSYFNLELEAARQEVNAGVRGSGRFDAVVDFDAATRDPQKPLRLSTAADGGDHLHPGPDGYKIMAGAVDLGLFGK